MASQITKPQVEVPSSELPGLENALSIVEMFTAQLTPLQQKARTIEVKDKNAYAEIGEVLTEVRNLRKQGGAQFSPFDLIVDRVRTFLRTKRQKHENACEEIESICKAKMKIFEQEELKAAQAEEAKLNKKAEKRGEPPVEVQPAIPTVAGYRRTTNYRFEVVDADKVKRDFLTPDLARIGQKVRADKDPALSVKEIGGIKVWKD